MKRQHKNWPFTYAQWKIVILNWFLFNMGVNLELIFYMECSFCCAVAAFWRKKNCDFWYFDKNCGLVFLFSSGIYDMGDLPGGGNGVWKCNIVFPWAFWLFLFFVRSNLVEMRTHLVKWKFFVWSVAFSFFFVQIFLFCFHQ